MVNSAIFDAGKVIPVLAIAGLLAFQAVASPQPETQKPRHDAGKSATEEPSSPPAEELEKAATKTDAELNKKPGQRWIGLSGTVAETHRGSFTLDYGEGRIVVELNGSDWFDRSKRITPGEKVRVYGELNDKFYKRRTIRPDSIYVFDREKFYFPDNDRKKPAYFLTTIPAELPDGTWVSAAGIVTQVSGRKFTISTGMHAIEVDTDKLGYNPLDGAGLQRVHVGDRVYVSGTLAGDGVEDREILAQTVTSPSPVPSPTRKR